MTAMWMVRAGRGGEHVEEFLDQGVVALDDERLGPLSPGVKKEELLRLYAEKYPEKNEAACGVWASQFLRFISEMKVGDVAVTFDRDRRLYFTGSITSDYAWDPKLIDGNPHVRHVKWTHQVPRDPLSVASRNTLGAIQTLFKLGSEVAHDLTSHQQSIGASGSPPPTETIPVQSGTDSNGEEVASEVIEKADEFIEDAINRLDWDETQELVAGILRAMGYRTHVTGPGSDRGVDIFASPDGLGLQEPRIFVEVKHRTQTPMGADKIRSFLGGRRAGDRCLYVSTGSFTKEARYEAERASVPITLIDIQELRRLLLDNYEKLDAETRALVPLRRLYWPVK